MCVFFAVEKQSRLNARLYAKTVVIKETAVILKQLTSKIHHYLHINNLATQYFVHTLHF